MFTGIIEATGKVAALRSGRLEIETGLALEAGDSISVDGVCLTASRCAGGRFAADLSQQTVSRTTLGALSPGSPVNLERPVAASGRLGGHIVQGHVDAVGQISEIAPQGGSTAMLITAPDEITPYLAARGSIAVDGVSLTVSGIQGGCFSVDLVPFTLASTTLGSKGEGQLVNLEADILAKYVESLLKGRAAT